MPHPSRVLLWGIATAFGITLLGLTPAMEQFRWPGAIAVMFINPPDNLAPQYNQAFYNLVFFVSNVVLWTVPSTIAVYAILRGRG